MRTLSRFAPIGSRIFDFLERIPMANDRRERLYFYVFNKVKLRHYLKRRRFRDRRLRQAYKAPSRSIGQILTSGLVGFLRGLEQIGMGAIVAFILRRITSLHVDHVKVRSLYMRVFGEESAVRMALESRIYVAGDILAGRPLNWPQTVATYNKFKVLHIFLEPGGRLPEWIGKSEFGRMKFIIYSFADVDDQISEAGITNRTRQSTLRDRFNDISEEGEALFRNATGFAERLTDTIVQKFPMEGLSIVDNKSRLRNCLVTGLDTLLSSRLSLLQCYAAAIHDIPDNQPIVFCAETPQYILPGWSVLTKGRRLELFGVSHAAPNRAAAEDFASDLYIRVLALPPTRTSADGDESPIEGILTRWTAFMKVTGSGVEAYAGDIANRAGDGSISLVLHAESAKPYQQTLQIIGEALKGKRGLDEQAPFDTVIYLHAALSRESLIIPGLIGGDTPKKQTGLTEFALDMGGLEVLTRPYITNAYDLERVAQYILNLSGNFSVAGTDMTDFLAVPLERYLRRHLPWIVIAYMLGQRLPTQVKPDAVFASTSRHWMSRSICAGFLDAQDTIAELSPSKVESPRAPLIDVQTMNVLDHPKYKTPMASHLTLIDNQARDIHVRAFDISADRTRLVGAPPNDLIARKISSIDTTSVRHDLNIHPDARVVTLISQLQPMDRMLQIASPLAELMTDSDVVVVIRLHPREGQGRLSAYQTLFDNAGLGTKIRFSRTETPEAILAISDVCVTIYSNMAREAALVGIPIISIEFFDWKPPISLSEEGLALPAETPEHLIARLRSLIATDQKQTLKNPYLEANPHIMEATAGAQIVDYARELTGVRARRDIRRRTTRFSNHPLLEVFSSGHFVCASDVKLRFVPSIFSPFADLSVFTSDVSGDPGFLPQTSNIITGVYSSGEDKRLKNIVTEANGFTQNLCSALLDWTSALGPVHDDLVRLRQSIWLQMRPTAIRGYRAFSTRRRGVETGTSKALILHSTDDSVLRAMCIEALALHGTGAPIFALRTFDDLSYELIDAARIQDGPDISPVAKRLPAPAKSFVTKSSASLVRWWFGMMETPEIASTGRRILITTDWRLKTVPPTLIPLILAQKSRGTNIVIANIADRGLEVIGSDINAHSKESDHAEIICPETVAARYPTPPGRVLKRLARDARTSILQGEYFAQLDPELQIMAGRMIDVFVRGRMVEILLWDRYCKAFLLSPQGASIACPGRQWHAQVAHDAADLHGRFSMTVQNSYMTDGYTYTRPTGQYLTAIDEWSRDLFVDAFKLDPSTVHITSTPRFDYLSNLESLSQASARNDAKLEINDAVVLFAAQDRFVDDALIIIGELARLTTVGDRPIQVIAKLHPRTSAEDIAMYRAAADTVNPDHRVRIVSDTRIETYLAACDVVITMFSNVGTEAAILQKDLIIVNLTGGSLPLPMDEFNIGHVVARREDIMPSVERFFTDQAFKDVQAKRVKRFRSANPHMVEGTSTHMLDDVIARAIR